MDGNGSSPDGALIGNIRYNGHRQNYVSTDGGAKWYFFFLIMLRQHYQLQPKAVREVLS